MEQEYNESPEIVSWVDGEESKLTIQFGLVNVERESINLMMNENGCYLIAPADDVQYVATFSFFHAVKPAEARAEFEDGYLTVEVPFKDSPACVKIPVGGTEIETEISAQEQS